MNLKATIAWLDVTLPLLERLPLLKCGDCGVIEDDCQCDPVVVRCEQCWHLVDECECDDELVDVIDEETRFGFQHADHD